MPKQTNYNYYSLSPHLTEPRNPRGPLTYKPNQLNRSAGMREPTQAYVVYVSYVSYVSYWLHKSNRTLTFESETKSGGFFGGIFQK